MCPLSKLLPEPHTTTGLVLDLPHATAGARHHLETFEGP